MHTRIPSLYLKKIKMTTSQAHFKWTMINLSILCYEIFPRIWQFICKILIIQYWLAMAARIWSNNNTPLTCSRITNFNFFFTAGIFALICSCHVFGLVLLLSLNFLFTRGYYIATWVEIFDMIVIFSTRYTELKFQPWMKISI